MKILEIFFFLLVALNSSAQFTNVLISSSGTPNEPAIAINPTNPNEVVAASNIDNFYLSNDGGKTWTIHKITSRWGVWGDPVLQYDTAGRFYFLHLANPPTGNWIDRIVVQRFDDLSTNFVVDTFFGLAGNKAQDKHWTAVDQNSNVIYATWTQFDKYGSKSKSDSSNILFTKSTDNGQTWSLTKQINQFSGDCLDDDSTTEGAVPCVGPNGELYVAWAMADGIKFDRSLDGGDTWLENDIQVSDNPGGWNLDIPGIYRSNGLPITQCDISGKENNGTIYINWTDQRNGSDDTDVWIVKSKDGGNTWSNPIKVNDDNSKKHQFLSWLTIDQSTGFLYIIFYDRRNYSDNQTDVYLAVSKDGGNSFKNYKISDSPFIPNESVFFGDYTNISVINGMIRPIWTRLDDDSLGLYTAIIDTSMLTGLNDYTPSNPIQNAYPNPFYETAYLAFKVQEKQSVSLSVIDFTGRKIETIIDQKILERGKYIEKFEAEEYNLSEGMYYFSLQVGNSFTQQKILYLE